MNVGQRDPRRVKVAFEAVLGIRVTECGPKRIVDVETLALSLLGGDACDESGGLPSKRPNLYQVTFDSVGQYLAHEVIDICPLLNGCHVTSCPRRRQTRGKSQSTEHGVA